MTYTAAEYSGTIRVDPDHGAGSGGVTGSAISFTLPQIDGWGANDAIIASIVTNGAITASPPGWTLLGHVSASSPSSGGGAYATDYIKGYNQTDIHLYAYSKDVVDETTDKGAVASGWTRTDTGLWCINLLRLGGGTNKPVCITVATDAINTTGGATIDAPVVAAGTKDAYVYQLAASKIFDLYSGSTIGIPDNALSQPFWFNSRFIHWYESITAGNSSSGSTFTVGNLMNSGLAFSPTDNALVAMSLAFYDVKSVDVIDGVEIYADALKDGQKAERMVEPIGMGGEVARLGSVGNAADIISAVDLGLTGSGVRSGRTLTDTASIAEAFELVLGKSINDAIQLAEAVWPNWKLGVTITEKTVQLAARLAIAYPVSSADNLAFEDALKCVAAAQVIEKLGLAEVLTPNAIFGLTLTQTVRLSSTLRRFFGGEAFDAFSFSDDMLAKPVKSSVATDGLGVHDAIAPYMIFRVICDEDVAINGAFLPHMIFNGKAFEGLEISAGLVQPNGSITTWAVNVRNGAVTEYQNYAFNSFAQMGNKYLGASETGLYELLGDDDDGDSIVARLKTGFMQFGSMHLSSIKGIYMGVRGAGEFFLKIEDGAKNVTTYRALAKDFETTRIRTGKGLRARFFSFELISTGQDFDLEAVEFIPLVAARR